MPTHLNSVLLCERRNSVIKSFGQGGSVISVAYSAYGGRPPRAMAPVIGFNGQRAESLTGWYLLGHGHRVYNPMLQRFHSPDHLSPFGKGGLNAYAYCLGDPVNYEDPTGQFVRQIVAGVVSKVRETVGTIDAYLHRYNRWLLSLNDANFLDHLDDLAAVFEFNRNAAVGGFLLTASPPFAFIGITMETVALSLRSISAFTRNAPVLFYNALNIQETIQAGVSRVSRGLDVLNQTRANYWGLRDPSSTSRHSLNALAIRQV